MSHYKKYGLKASICMIFFLPLSTLSYDKVKLTTHNLCPYGCYAGLEVGGLNNTKLFKGIAVDVVRCVFKKMNTEVEIKVLPWPRAQLYITNNKADGFFAASQKKSRDEIAVMSGVIAEQNWQWYMLKDSNISPKQINFKKKATFGGFIGSNMLDWLMKNDYNVIAKPTDTNNLLLMLLHKRVEVILANNFVMEDLLVKHNAKEKLQTFLNKKKPLGVYFSKSFLKDKPSFMSEFNSHIKQCRN